jgi:hypothetical protein
MRRNTPSPNHGEMPCAGLPLGIFFRAMDPSVPDVQQRMLNAYKEVNSSPVISATHSPPVLWLQAFQQYVQQMAPRDVGPGGIVLQSSFYLHLPKFLKLQVCCGNSSATCREMIVLFRQCCDRNYADMVLL